MAASKVSTTQAIPRLFTFTLDIRAAFWGLVFDKWIVFKADTGNRGYIGHAREILCKGTMPSWQLSLARRFLQDDCSQFFWSKAQVLYFNKSPRTKDFSRSLGDHTLSAGKHYIRSLHIITSSRDWLVCELWALVDFPALQNLHLGQLLLCRVPNGAELDLPTWAATSDVKENAVRELADRLAMAQSHRPRMQRIDRQFFHLVETVFRPSRVITSPLFAMSHAKLNGKRIIEVGGKFMLRGHHRRSPRGEKRKQSR
jgi:hypothetical protein